MYYKIVDENLNSLYSNLLGSISIKYKKKEWVKPNYEIAPICVFKNKESVENFLIRNPNVKYYNIFECAIEKSDREWRRFVGLSEIQSYIDKSRNDFWMGKWPHGTVLADRVMLIRSINSPEPTKTYFKITIPGLYSTSSESRRMKLDIKYELNSWVAPKETYAPLMIFDNFDSAKSFKDSSSFPEERWKIYKCHAIESKKKWGYISDDRRLEKIIKAIKNKRGKSSFFDRMLPDGTIFADAVKLLERVL